MSKPNGKSPQVKSVDRSPDPIASAPGTARMSDEQLLAILADTIKMLRKRAGEDIIEIGQRLTEAKALAGHGHWLPWLEREFGWTDQTARNYMQVHEMAKSQNFLNLDLPVSSLYLLAAPNTPPEARDAVIKRAETGEKLNGAKVKEIVHETKPHKPATSAKKSSPVVSPPRQGKKAREVEYQKLQDDRFEKSATILEDFHKEYYDMPVWGGVAHEIRMKLKALGRHLETPPPFGLAEAVAALIDQHGYDKVPDAVLEYNP